MDNKYLVVLRDFGAQKIQVIKVVWATTGLGLKEAKGIVDNVPVVVCSCETAARAGKIVAEMMSASEGTKADVAVAFSGSDVSVPCSILYMSRRGWGPPAHYSQDAIDDVAPAREEDTSSPLPETNFVEATMPAREDLEAASVRQEHLRGMSVGEDKMPLVPFINRPPRMPGVCLFHVGGDGPAKGNPVYIMERAVIMWWPTTCPNDETDPARRRAIPVTAVRIVDDDANAKDYFFRETPEEVLAIVLAAREEYPTNDSREGIDRQWS